MWRLAVAKDSGDSTAFGVDYLRTLNGHVGRQTWVFEPEAGTAEERAHVERLRAKFTEHRLTHKHSSDELLRLQLAAARPTPLPSIQVPKFKEGTRATTEQVETSLKAGMDFYQGIQMPDGHWGGDYGGPMFLMPGLIITLYTTGAMDQVLSPAHKHEMTRYLKNHQNEDGGFGLHIEGHSTMFGTALSYVSLRLLGSSPAEPYMCDARRWIHAHGGAEYIPSWGKFWLSVLGVYSWDGLNPLTPEMWLLPHKGWTGIGWFHPGRFWCHCRMVYLPMSYVYGARGTCKRTELTAQIESELYPHPFGTIDWNAARNKCAKPDLYFPHPWFQDILWWALYKAEYVLMGSSLRKKALAECMRHIHYEDENTRYVDIGPVNKVINMLSCWLEDPNSEAFKRHLPRVYDYLWLAEDGLKMQGYNGSQLWDTAFAVQAICATGLQDHFKGALLKAHEYIKNSQVRVEAAAPLDEYYRHISKGAWPFSTQDHGWPISDCSSEGLKAALTLAAQPADMVGAPIEAGRLEEAVNVILSYQNSDGGWATYENTRSFAFLEYINPSETFGDIMIDYSYVECSSACMQSLASFAKKYPEHRKAEIARAMGRGRKFIRSIQKPDGSWYGSWAVCFTYGTWFGVLGLLAAGETYETSAPIRKAVNFLLSKQRANGGWGESYLSCQDKVYSELPDGRSHVVNTAWAMMTLIASGQHLRDRKPLDLAARHLVSVQEPNGDWPQQEIMGVFNRNCMITYANYRNIFPIWALGMYRTAVLAPPAQ